MKAFVLVLALSSVCQADLKVAIKRTDVEKACNGICTPTRPNISSRTSSRPSSKFVTIMINGRPMTLYRNKQDLVDKINADIARNKVIDQGRSFKLSTTVTRKCK